jgi:hypothetical protein
MFIDATSGDLSPEEIKQGIQVVKFGMNFHGFAGPDSG